MCINYDGFRIEFKLLILHSSVGQIWHHDEMKFSTYTSFVWASFIDATVFHVAAKTFCLPILRGNTLRCVELIKFIVIIVLKQSDRHE